MKLVEQEKLPKGQQLGLAFGSPTKVFAHLIKKQNRKEKKLGVSNMHTTCTQIHVHVHGWMVM